MFSHTGCFALVRLDNRAQAVEFLKDFLESEASNHFAVSFAPAGNPTDPATRGIRAQLGMHTGFSEMESEARSLLEYSFREGILSRWKSEGRVETARTVQSSGLVDFSPP